LKALQQEAQRLQKASALSVTQLCAEWVD